MLALTPSEPSCFSFIPASRCNPCLSSPFLVVFFHRSLVLAQEQAQGDNMASFEWMDKFNWIVAEWNMKEKRVLVFSERVDSLHSPLFFLLRGKPQSASVHLKQIHIHSRNDIRMGTNAFKEAQKALHRRALCRRPPIPSEQVRGFYLV